MLIYLSAPIDKAPVWEWLPHLELALAAETWGAEDAPVLFRPLAAFHSPQWERVPRRTRQEVVNINEHALSQADAMLLVYRPGVESWGCPMELAQIVSLHRPCFLFTQPEHNAHVNRSLYLSSLIPPERRFNEWPALVQALRQELNPVVSSPLQRISQIVQPFKIIEEAEND